MQTTILFTGDIIYWWINNTGENYLMFKCTIWLDAACLSSTLCESEAILSISESNLRPPLIWYVESHESDQSTRKTEGSPHTESTC